LIGAGKESLGHGAVAAGCTLGVALVAVVMAGLLPGTSVASAKPRAHASKAVTYVHRGFKITRPNQKRRLVVRCPGRSAPLGGGVTSFPPPSRDGEGIYPHSYERLGVQQGYHATVVLFDPTPRHTQPRHVTVQVACAHKRRHVTPPHSTVYVAPGRTRTAVATCPGRRHLFGGGFQRTDFTAMGGNYITESRAISQKSWSVTGHAFGAFGGQLTAIAYCWRTKHPLLTEVSGSTSVGAGGFGTATTPPCPIGHLVFGGFSTSPAGSAFLTNGAFDTGGGWSASAMNHFGPAATLAAYGYCLKL
jgi:hypothetical protein